MTKFKLPPTRAWKSYFKHNGTTLLAGIVLGAVGASIYLKRLSREAVVEIGSRTAGFGDITPTPEAKVFLAFILTGVLAALLVTHFVGRK